MSDIKTLLFLGDIKTIINICELNRHYYDMEM